MTFPIVLIGILKISNMATMPNAAPNKYKIALNIILFFLQR